MRYSKYFIPTLREVPADAEVVSHKLMARAGMIKKVASGIYSYLPLGLVVIKKVEDIVRKCMNEADAVELMMPSVQPAELWQESGRWDFYGKELLRIKDRHNREFCYGPTHEEVTTDIIRSYINSYKALPVNLYQIQTKFRDEVRPRFGLMRGREFIMKDAYSFDMDDAGANISYQKMYDAYRRIFEMCGLRYKVVDADSGAIGGSFSHEFMVLASTGEDFVISCNSCDYSANVEKATVRKSTEPFSGDMKAAEDINTPNAKTVADVAAFLNIKESEVIKTMVLNVDDKIIAVCIRGDHELNLAKVKNFFNASVAEFATPVEIYDNTGGPLGYSGPVGLKIPVYGDYAVEAMGNYCVGANEKEMHKINVNHGRDFNFESVDDFRNAEAGDVCCECGGTYEITKGIEVGHIFKLGTKYSSSMNAMYLDKDGKRKPFVMGCYGIGITRVVAAAIEQNHDEKGIVWPVNLAPFKICVLPLAMKDQEVSETAENIYKDLINKGVEVLLDDRDERPGVKFNDAELIGIPLRVVIGKKTLAQGKIEVTVRASGESYEVDVEGCVDVLLQKLEELAGR
ncbi:prolyl-tRNA synthetase [Denitrovibrio acetiphilus DSM 12809]|uniref:Proline--tRNA ligase n=1 Tax=Denitrovibrio acetiphilus (strain DSM 12809 / NBRC 114555 / N2460) TaxID=522772 RepID=D4H2S8_DENA2|nr:proline--tRNA ligase [Denitrovibrio acetiphilus]ADD67139.1 prolyl-tRNA synthetase [Denitrovibrio acetiphilus DSM 12809]